MANEQFNGYAEANKIDKQINELLQKFPITERNAMAWLAFARTIETSGHILRGTTETLLKMKEKGW